MFEDRRAQERKAQSVVSDAAQEESQRVVRRLFKQAVAVNKLHSASWVAWAKYEELSGFPGEHLISIISSNHLHLFRLVMDDRLGQATAGGGSVQLPELAERGVVPLLSGAPGPPTEGRQHGPLLLLPCAGGHPVPQVPASAAGVRPHGDLPRGREGGIEAA